MNKIIIGKIYDSYLVRILGEGETIGSPIDDYSPAQVINTDYKTISPIQSIGSIINMMPNFTKHIIENEVEIERLYASAREVFIK